LCERRPEFIAESWATANCGNDVKVAVYSSHFIVRVCVRLEELNHIVLVEVRCWWVMPRRYLGRRVINWACWTSNTGDAASLSDASKPLRFFLKAFGHISWICLGYKTLQNCLDICTCLFGMATVKCNRKSTQQEINLMIGAINVERRKQLSLLFCWLLPILLFTSFTCLFTYLVTYQLIVLMTSSQH